MYLDRKIKDMMNTSRTILDKALIEKKYNTFTCDSV